VRPARLFAVALLASWGVAIIPAHAQNVASSGPPPGVVDEPCPPPLQVPPELADIRRSPNPDALLEAAVKRALKNER
jgi:hypothetical protein